MITLGLTGSIGMGKTTTAAMFAEAGAVVYDADAAVHGLYARGGAAVAPVDREFPGVVVDGQVDRGLLSAALQDDPAALARLEKIVHPLVAQDRIETLARAREDGVGVMVLEVPLLFETGSDRAVDAIVVVSASAEVQSRRVLARAGMSTEKLRLLIGRQLADVEKRARADFVIDTGSGLEAARAQVRQVLKTVADPAWKSVRASS